MKNGRPSTPSILTEAMTTLSNQPADGAVTQVKWMRRNGRHCRGLHRPDTANSRPLLHLAFTAKCSPTDCVIYFNPSPTIFA